MFRKSPLTLTLSRKGRGKEGKGNMNPKFTADTLSEQPAIEQLK
jgi:hypothetical protein